MRTTAHILASSAAAGAAYALTGSAGMSVSCLLSGVLLDADHLPDFWLLSGERFTLKGFFSWCNELRWKRIYLFLHSYELFLLLALSAWAFPGRALEGALLGMGLHLLMDQAGNRGLDRRFYFLIFRYRAGFSREALAAGEGGRSAH
ncbi:MAG: hypothetical protein M0011_05805 [Elusimicrobia bacterium]|nr:hypothetical protein [Elusimicrobiota bacterium]